MAENKNVISKNNKLKDRLYQYISDNMGLIAIGMLSMNGNFTKQSYISYCNINKQ
ncbi:hypothetical protein [Lacrimispora aerotolerans]|uniref:hypothetical protein n=1 Tax=Lacrimispora aerotolerans TaxID=36832 RepID=UPI000A91F4B3|nr:hypothetical protein [Lacrimispora aerotolerans]